MSRRIRQALGLARWALATLLVPGGLGCGALLGGVAKEATPGVVAGAVEGLADPATQQRLVAGLDEARLEELTRRLSAGTVDGLLDSLEDPARRARIEALVGALATRAIGGAVDAMMARALDDGTQARLRLALTRAVTEVIGAASESVGAELGRPEDRTAAIGLVAHELARQATLGFQEALDETRRDRERGTMPPGDGALVIAAGDASRTGDRIVWTLGVGLATLSLGLGLTLLWAIRKNRLRRTELAERDGAIGLLTQAIKSAAALPGADDLHRALVSGLEDRASGERVRRVLGAHGLELPARPPTDGPEPPQAQR